MCWNLKLEICLEFGIGIFPVRYETGLVKDPQINPIIVSLVLIQRAG